MYTVYFKGTSSPKFDELSSPVPNSWIHVSQASKNDIQVIASFLEISWQDIQDSLDTMEIARIERIERDVFVVYTRFPIFIEVGVYTSTLTIIISNDFLVTISPIKCDIVDRIIVSPPEIQTQMRAKLLIEILLRIVQDYTRVINQIRSEVITKEKDIKHVTDNDITALTRKEENLTQCLNTLQPLKQVIEEIRSGKFIILYEKDQNLLEDLSLSTKQAEDTCTLSLQIISSLRDSVQILITNQFNKTIKLLTSLTIILNLPTTISSIYGMNVPLPMETSSLAFPLIITFIIGISVLTYFFFQKRKWI